MIICVICCRRQIKQGRLLSLRLAKMHTGSDITEDTTGIMVINPARNMSESINYLMSTGQSSPILVFDAESHNIDTQPAVPPPSSATTDDQSYARQKYNIQKPMVNIQQQQHIYPLPIIGYPNNVQFGAAGAMNFNSNNMNMNNINYNGAAGMYPMNNNFNGNNIVSVQQSRIGIVRIKPGCSIFTFTFFFIYFFDIRSIICINCSIIK